MDFMLQGAKMMSKGQEVGQRAAFSSARDLLCLRTQAGPQSEHFAAVNHTL